MNKIYLAYSFLDFIYLNTDTAIYIFLKFETMYVEVIAKMWNIFTKGNSV